MSDKDKNVRLDVEHINKKNTIYREYVMKKAAIYKIVVFLIVLTAGAVLSLIIPLRPTVSVNEKRTLTKFPEFSLESFLNGEYFSGIDTWFADTFPYRDQLIACNDKVVSLYGIRDTVIHGDVVKGDAIPNVDVDIENINKTTASETKPGESETAGGSDDGSKAAAETEADSKTAETNPQTTQSDIKDSSGESAASAGEQIGSVFIYGTSAYDYYGFSQKYSDAYVDIVNSLAGKLDGKAVLYDVVVPTSIDITLDDNVRKKLSSSNQKDAILYMYSKMSSKVNKTYVYDVLREHRDEYLFFRTDHHWTALGAYYTYTTLAKQMGIVPNRLESFEKMEFSNFKGSFCTVTGSAALSNNPDTLIAYKPMATNRIKYTDKKGNVIDYNVITDVTNWQPVNRYSAFIGGDNPYTEINNPLLKDGSACLVIKESYGNAFVPFLVDHFENVYVIDYRYYKGTVSELVEQKGIQTVIMINNVAATSTDLRVNEMEKVCK